LGEGFGPVLHVEPEAGVVGVDLPHLGLLGDELRGMQAQSLVFEAYDHRVPGHLALEHPGGALRHDRAVVHDHEPVARDVRLLQVVGREEHGRPPVPDRPEPGVPEGDVTSVLDEADLIVTAGEREIVKDIERESGARPWWKVWGRKAASGPNLSDR
jgi:hypothetical protein